MKFTKKILLPLVAGTFALYACGGEDSSSGNSYNEDNFVENPYEDPYEIHSSGEINPQSSSDYYPNSSGSEQLFPETTNPENVSSSSVSAPVVQIAVPDACQSGEGSTAIGTEDNLTYICIEGHNAIKLNDRDDLYYQNIECDSTRYGQFAYVPDYDQSFTCSLDNEWLAGFLKIVRDNVVAVADAACADSLDGIKAIDESQTGVFICQGGVWSLYQSLLGEQFDVVPVDYAKGRAMNKRLGKGMNLGNSWDSRAGSDDCGWNNCIQDSYFGIIKDAGFNSIRLPVRWQGDANNTSVSSSRLAGVKDDISKAIAAGLVVIVNFHHYDELNELGTEYSKDPNNYRTAFMNEKQKFLNLWTQVAKEMNSFPDDKLVLEVWNEPTIPNAGIVDTILNEAYKVIRANAPGKTIMFQAYHAAKFYDINKFRFPADGNIIFSGHYYEPFPFTHQSHGYECRGDVTYKSTAAEDMKSYAEMAKKYYPDIDGVNAIPLNMGEFGVSGCASLEKRVEWTKLAVQAAEANGISWHYWGFTSVGGFESYRGGWMDGFLGAFGLK